MQSYEAVFPFERKDHGHFLAYLPYRNLLGKFCSDPESRRTGVQVYNYCTSTRLAIVSFPLPKS